MSGPMVSADHVARVHRVIVDAGPTPGVEQQTDADYSDWVERILRDHQAPGKPLQLFAYGSRWPVFWHGPAVIGARGRIIL